MRFKYSTKYNARQAFLRRLKCYWSAKGFPRFNTYIGEIYEIDFGENAGSEFSGRHLAICLSDTSIAEDRMLVIPITTKYEKYNFQDNFRTFKRKFSVYFSDTNGSRFMGR